MLTQKCGFVEGCHPERSEGSQEYAGREMLRYAQHDMLS